MERIPLVNKKGHGKEQKGGFVPNISKYGVSKEPTTEPTIIWSSLSLSLSLSRLLKEFNRAT